MTSTSSTISGGSRRRDRRDSTRIPPNGTPGYTLLNLRGGYRVSEQSLIWLELTNLLDKNYRTHGSGVQEAGFNISLGADIRF